MKHPITSCEIRTYSSKAHGWVAQFGDGIKFPILFRGKTKAEVMEIMEIHRKRVIALARKEARRKAAKKAVETKEIMT